MRTKDKSPAADSKDSPPFWAVRFLIATDEGKTDEAREANERLKALGWKITPVKRGAQS